MSERRLARLLRQGQQRHRAGDHAAALAAYEEILELRPGVPEVLVLAATAAAELGRLEDAERLVRRALHARPDGPGQLILGRVLLARGAAAEAAEPLRAATADPRVAADAWLLLAEAHRAAGARDAALPACARAVEANPRHARAWLVLSQLLHAEGRADESRDALGRALKLEPDNPALLAAAAGAALAAGRYEEAEQVVARLDPDAPTALALLGKLRQAQGRLEEALAAWERLILRRPEDPAAWHGLAATRQAAGRLAEAGEAYARGLALAPSDPDLLAGRAEWLEWQGRYEEGLASLAAAVGGPDEAADPGLSLVTARLLRRVGRSAEARELLLAADRPGLDATLRRQLCFSLGDTAAELGDYDAAFAGYAQGNRLAPLSWDGGAERAWQARLDALAAEPGHGARGREMIFIVGMPRSGTTLVEQILAAHPSVHAGGESAALGELAHEAAAAARPPGAEALAELGRRYLATWSDAPSGATRITDKMPLNFRYLGLMQAALPGARVIHCRRDPRDVALSCFATDFIDPALGFATRLDWLADFLRFYEEIMARWRGRLALPLLELDYEALVRAPEAEVRRLLDFGGLPWDDVCLQFHRQGRVAATASHAQVREPIHARSIGRWRHYRTHLGPLGELLERP